MQSLPVVDVRKELIEEVVLLVVDAVVPLVSVLVAPVVGSV
jgi:hypothetical protein